MNKYLNCSNVKTSDECLQCKVYFHDKYYLISYWNTFGRVVFFELHSNSSITPIGDWYRLSSKVQSLDTLNLVKKHRTVCCTYRLD